MVSQNINNSDNGETTTQQVTPPNEPREQYVRLLQDYHADSSLTYDRLAQNVLRDPALGQQYDQEVVKQALKSTEIPPEKVIAVIAQGPYVQNQLSVDKQQNVSEYLAEVQRSYTAAQNIQQAQTSKQSNNSNQPDQQQPTVIPDVKPGVGLETSAVQTSSREAEDYALSLVQSLDQRRINVDRLQIDVNSQTVFKMRDGDIDSRKTSITNEHTELLKKALSDPVSLNGSIKITQGNQVLLHVKDGRVLIDSAGLTKQSAKVEVQTPDSPSKGLYERFSKEINSSGLQATKEIAANALNAGIKREQVMEMLKAYDSSYHKLSQTQGEEVADQTLGKMMDATEVKLVQEKIPQQQQSQEVKVSRAVKV